MKRFLLLSLSLLVLFFTACSIPLPTINSFTASPASLPAGGGSVTLSWDVKDATTVSIDGGVGEVTGTSKAVAVTSNKTFTLTATNASGATTQTTSVSVGAGADTTPPTVISVEPTDGATGVKFEANIVITFSEKMDQVATQNAFQSESNLGGELTFNWNAEGTVLTIDPAGGFGYARGEDVNTLAPRTFNFTLGAAAKDSAGNALTSVSSSFSTLRRVQFDLQAIRDYSGTASNAGVFYKAPNTLELGDFSRLDGSKIISRAFLTFDLSKIPSDIVDFDYAVLAVYKLGIVGNPYAFGFVGTNHVSGGTATTGDVYNTPNLGSLGAIDDSSEAFDRYVALDVLSAVRDDINNRASRNNLSQYMLAFPGIATNNDNQSDYVIYSSGFGDVNTSPKLQISYLIP